MLLTTTTSSHGRNAIHQAREVADAIFHAAGAGAIYAGNPLERRMRDIIAVSDHSRRTTPACPHESAFGRVTERMDLLLNQRHLASF